MDLAFACILPIQFSCKCIISLALLFNNNNNILT